MSKFVSRAAAAALAVGVLVGSTNGPAEAVTKKKKVTTTKRKSSRKVAVSSSTLPPVLPPPPTTVAAIVPDPNALAPVPSVVVAQPAPTAPPTTALTAETIRASFARMFLPRDIWRFDSDLAMSANVEALRLDLNSSLRVDVYIAGDARIMKTTADNRTVALVLALVADPKFIRPDVLQASVRRASAGFVDTKVLRVDGGVAIAGTVDGLGVALVAFENFFIEVLAVDRQRAVDAAFLVSTNMGHHLTE